jgi:hypothetical protein
MTPTSETPLPIRVVSMVLAILIVGAALFWLSLESRTPPEPIERRKPAQAREKPEADDEPRSLAQRPRRERARPDPERDARRTAQLYRMPPLPAADAPLAQQLPVLVPRARAGDGDAACRLVMSIQRCRDERQRRDAHAARVRSQQSGVELDGEASSELSAAQQAYCDGVDLDLLPRGESLLGHAMDRLTPRQKTVIALMRSDGRVRRLAAQDEASSQDALYVYPQILADHAYDFLLDGYEAGDPLALEGLVMLHAPGQGIAAAGTGPSMPNPRLFLQYAWLMERLFGADALGTATMELMQIAAGTMTPAQLAQIRRVVDVEAEKWTSGVGRSDSRKTQRERWDELVRAGDELESCVE